MAITIPHRFSKQIVSPSFKINTVIIGTFNPGNPIVSKLTLEEKRAFNEISSTKKYQRFSEVRNFYDRPQNRFWKVMDIINCPKFYCENSYRTKNSKGLKFYQGMDRQEVNLRQLDFCNSKGIFITDIVSQITTNEFHDIYQNFPDKAIEKSECLWNTNNILASIEQNNPDRIIFNFNESKTIPKISKQIMIIKNLYPTKVYSVLSTSGAAGYTYESLFESWKSHI